METNQTTPSNSGESLIMPEDITKEPASTPAQTPSAPPIEQTPPAQPAPPAPEPQIPTSAPAIEPPKKKELDPAEQAVRKAKMKNILKIVIVIINFTLVGLLLYYYFVMSKK